MPQERAVCMASVTLITLIVWSWTCGAKMIQAFETFSEFYCKHTHTNHAKHTEDFKTADKAAKGSLLHWYLGVSGACGSPIFWFAKNNAFARVRHGEKRLRGCILWVPWNSNIPYSKHTWRKDVYMYYLIVVVQRQGWQQYMCASLISASLPLALGKPSSIVCSCSHADSGPRSSGLALQCSIVLGTRLSSNHGGLLFQCE